MADISNELRLVSNVMPEYEIKCSTIDEPELQQHLCNVLGQDCPLIPDGRWSPESAARYQCCILSDLSQWELEQRLRKGGLSDCSIRRLSERCARST